MGHLSSIVAYFGDVDIAQHVDVDAMRAETSPQYGMTVEKARHLLRTIEVAVQALYDDTASLFEAIQAPPIWDQHTQHPGSDTQGSYEFVEGLVITLRKNLSLASSNLEGLFLIGRDQAEIGSNAYSNSIEWRRSRGSVLDYAGANGSIPREEDGEVLDIGDVLGGDYRPPIGTQYSSSSAPYSSQQPSDTSLETGGTREDPSEPQSEPSTMVDPNDDADLSEDDVFGDEGRKSSVTELPGNCVLSLLTSFE